MTALAEGVSQPLKWHGGKAYLADWIIGLMPPRVAKPNAPAPDDFGWVHYVEPYAGGLSVLLRLDKGGSEIANDRNPWLSNFWDVIATPALFEQFQRDVEAIPLSEPHFEAALEVMKRQPTGNYVDDAVTFFVVARQSRQGLCRDFATMTRNRTRRGMNEQASSWLSAVDGLPDVHDRLRGVVVMNKPAIEVIRQQDGPRTLFYLDPPYLHETRVTTSDYLFEMKPEDHEELLTALASIEGKFLLSGYPSEMYRVHAERNGWRCETREIDNKASSAKDKAMKTECLWMNS